MMGVLALSEQNERKQSILFREALASSSIGWEIALPIGGGALLGQVVDRALDTAIVFTVLFLMLGVFSGGYNLYRHVQRINSQITVSKGKPISDEEWEAWDEEWEEEDEEDDWDEFVSDDEEEEA